MLFLDSSRHVLRAWRAIIRASFTREAEFRANFLFGILRQVLWLISFIFFIDVIFQNTSNLAGWSKADVLVVLALSRLIEGLINSFFSGNLAELPWTVQSGEFDFFVVKPLPVQLYTAFRKVNLYNLGNLAGGLALLLYALSLRAHAVSGTQVVLGCIFAALGLTIYYCIMIITASLVFYFERLEAVYALSSLYTEPLTVPFTVFPRAPRLALTYFLPLAFVVFVPAQAVTGRLSWGYVPIGIAMAVIFLILANLAWRAGLRKYSSASS